MFSWLKESAKPALLFLSPSSILFRPLPNRYMPLDTAHFLAGIVAFFHGRIRVLHALRTNHQESGCFMASPLAACCGHLIVLTLLQGCRCRFRGNRSISGNRNARRAIGGNRPAGHTGHSRYAADRGWRKRHRTSPLCAVPCVYS